MVLHKDLPPLLDSSGVYNGFIAPRVVRVGGTSAKRLCTYYYNYITSSLPQRWKIVPGVCTNGCCTPRTVPGSVLASASADGGSVPFRVRVQWLEFNTMHDAGTFVLRNRGTRHGVLLKFAWRWPCFAASLRARGL